MLLSLPQYSAAAGVGSAASASVPLLLTAFGAIASSYVAIRVLSETTALLEQSKEKEEANAMAILPVMTVVAVATIAAGTCESERAKMEEAERTMMVPLDLTMLAMDNAQRAAQRNQTW